jgi:hypothetical protein
MVHIKKGRLTDLVVEYHRLKEETVVFKPYVILVMRVILSINRLRIVEDRKKS